MFEPCGSRRRDPSALALRGPIYGFTTTPIQSHQPTFATRGASLGARSVFSSVAPSSHPVRAADNTASTRLNWFSTRIVRELSNRVSMNSQVLCGDFATNVGLKEQGATVVNRNPLIFLVAGACSHRHQQHSTSRLTSCRVLNASGSARVANRPRPGSHP